MSKQMNTSIKHTLVCAALFSALGATSQAQAGDAKNVILFIGDGMGLPCSPPPACSRWEKRAIWR